MSFPSLLAVLKKTVGFKASPARFQLLLLGVLSKPLALKPFLIAAQPLLIAVFTQLFAVSLSCLLPNLSLSLSFNSIVGCTALSACCPACPNSCPNSTACLRPFLLAAQPLLIAVLTQLFAL
jgi:hypothetical protein